MKRRDFARSLLLGCTAPLGLLNKELFAAYNDGALTGYTPATNTASRRLVLIELAGANDGLNTLVPYRNDHYYKLRPTLGLQSGDLLPLSDDQAVHLSLRPLMRLWERGELAWVQGLGYPAASRSHFKSIALWETAGDGETPRMDQGWITHAIEHQMAHAINDPHGISLAGDMDIFASESGRWLSLDNTEQLKSTQVPTSTTTHYEHPALATVQGRLQILDQTLNRLTEKVARAPAVPAFDAKGFGEQLRQVAILIAAGVDTPVYRVRLDGFDTHENQQGRHARLLDVLARGLNEFSDTLIRMGEWQNTLIMTYSEFGRRAAENHSAGTDHGTAAPHLVLGGAVKGGLYGVAPDLADLPDGDPLFTLDYRALYQRMLHDGLGCTGTLASLDAYRSELLSDLFQRT